MTRDRLRAFQTSCPFETAHLPKPMPTITADSLADRVAGALWGMLIADAISISCIGSTAFLSQASAACAGHAAPAPDMHVVPVSFSAGASQIRRFWQADCRVSGAALECWPIPRVNYGAQLAGSAGRGSSEGDISGTVINPGKKEFWKRGSGYHYHCTLSKGENTLEGEMARLAMRSMTAGDFDLDRMQQEYVEFMTTPGSHNDAYASSYTACSSRIVPGARHCATVRPTTATT